jgi:uncharacterized protein (TIGR02996 family)
MSDHAPFLDAIIDNRLDDGPRLVYADWLDERGDPRGEFIRVGCEIAAREAAGDYDDRYLDLVAREQELLDQIGTRRGDDWNALIRRGTDVILPNPYRPDFGIGWVHWSFRRGFIDGLVCDPPLWVSHWKELMAAVPFTRLMIAPFNGLPPPSETTENYIRNIAVELAGCDGIRRLESLTFSTMPVSPHFLTHLIGGGNTSVASLKYLHLTPSPSRPNEVMRVIENLFRCDVRVCLDMPTPEVLRYAHQNWGAVGAASGRAINFSDVWRRRIPQG